MADYQHHEVKNDEPCDSAPAHTPVKIEESEPVEATDRGLFDFMGKKKEEDKCVEDVIASDFDKKVQVCEDKKEEPKEEGKKHESLLEKLHRSSSSSSSSSDEEEVGEGGEKKKKKGLKDKIKGKVSGEKKEEPMGTSVPVEKFDEFPTPEPEEKKGFLDKIKEKLPGGGKKAEEVSAPPPHKAEEVECAEGEGKEKKGFLDKIKEKLPGYHPKSDEEKVKETKGEEAACR